MPASRQTFLIIYKAVHEILYRTHILHFICFLRCIKHYTRHYTRQISVIVYIEQQCIKQGSRSARLSPQSMTILRVHVQQCVSSDSVKVEWISQKYTWGKYTFEEKNTFRKYTFGNTICENTFLENTLSENTLSENTLSENTLSENTHSENTLSANTLLENTLSENTLSEQTFSVFLSWVTIFIHKSHINQASLANRWGPGTRACIDQTWAQ